MFPPQAPLANGQGIKQGAAAMSKRLKPFGQISWSAAPRQVLASHFARTLARPAHHCDRGAWRRPAGASLQAELHKAGARLPPSISTCDRRRRWCPLGCREALGAIDIVVNNAGISIIEVALDARRRTWDAVVDTNLRGAWLVIRGPRPSAG
jgi:NAD(P)-dependent dehydrogenase (short-subunit alcohol dehydrogenase family)